MSGPLYFDRTQESSTTTGTGTYTLSGATTGYQPWSVVGNTNTAYYMATDGTGWEVGLGTYTSSGTTLARTTILESSNANAAVSWAAGIKTVSLVEPALVSGGGETLLATLATTSGSSVTATGLPTVYHYFRIDFIGVDTSSHTGPPNFTMSISSDNGSTFGTAITIAAIGAANYGYIFIFGTGQTATKTVMSGYSNTGGVAGPTGGFDGTKTGLTNSLKFSTSSSTFTTGSILIYGVK